MRAGNSRRREASQEAVAKPNGGMWWPIVEERKQSRRLREDFFAGRARKRCGQEGPIALFWAVGFQFLLVILSQILGKWIHKSNTQ